MMITTVMIVDDSGGSSFLIATCRFGTENHRSSGVNRGSEIENVDLEQKIIDLLALIVDLKLKM